MTELADKVDKATCKHAVGRPPERLGDGGPGQELVLLVPLEVKVKVGLKQEGGPKKM